MFRRKIDMILCKDWTGKFGSLTKKSWIDQFYIRKQRSQSNRRIEMKFCIKSINMFSYLG